VHAGVRATNTGGGLAILASGDLEVTGALVVTGDVTASGSFLSELAAKYKTSTTERENIANLAVAGAIDEHLVSEVLPPGRYLIIGGFRSSAQSNGIRLNLAGGTATATPVGLAWEIINANASPPVFVAAAAGGLLTTPVTYPGPSVDLVIRVSGTIEVTEAVTIGLRWLLFTSGTPPTNLLNNYSYLEFRRIA
jgi:hypothetical protein